MAPLLRQTKVQMVQKWVSHFQTTEWPLYAGNCCAHRIREVLAQVMWAPLLDNCKCGFLGRCVDEKSGDFVQRRVLNNLAQTQQLAVWSWNWSEGVKRKGKLSCTPQQTHITCKCRVQGNPPPPARHGNCLSNSITRQISIRLCLDNVLLFTLSPWQIKNCCCQTTRVLCTLRGT